VHEFLRRLFTSEPPAPRPVPPPRPRADKSFLASALESVDQGVLVVDPKLRIAFCNAPLAPLLNHPWTEAKGLSLWAALRHREANELVAEALASRAGETRELTFHLPSETVWRVSVRPFPTEGPLAGVVVTFQDVTPLRRLESMRKDFVANVSHELRTPLTALRAALETLLEGALDDRAHARDFLETAQTQVDRLQRLIDDLLTLSRLDKPGTPAPRDAAASVRTAGDKVIKALSPIAQRAGVGITAQWSAEDIKVPFSEDELAQIFMNLLDNAIKFNKPGGAVTVALSAENGKALLRVKDTGVGIPAADIPRVFERFYRVDKARSGGGTGLGLSIVKHIVENADGAVAVTSRPDEGTEFMITLPLK